MEAVPRLTAATKEETDSKGAADVGSKLVSGREELLQLPLAWCPRLQTLLVASDARRTHQASAHNMKNYPDIFERFGHACLKGMLDCIKLVSHS